MDLSKSQSKIIVAWVNFILDRLFAGVQGDRAAELEIMHSLRIQDTQVAAWRIGRNLPNTATLYTLAEAAGVLEELAEAFENAPSLQHLPKLLPATKKSEV